MYNCFTCDVQVAISNSSSFWCLNTLTFRTHNQKCQRLDLNKQIDLGLMITLDPDLVSQLLLDQQGSFAFARITHLQEILRPNTD